LRAILSIALRELRSFFVSPAAYIVTIVFLGIAGLIYNYRVAQHILDTLSSGATRSPGLSVTGGVLQPFFVRTLFSLLLIVTPLICMRLLSEDRKQGTADLLLTSPISTLQLVLGKYLGAMVFMTLLLLLTVPMPLVLIVKGNADGGVAISGYLGLYLTAALFVAAGTFASSLTENQIVSALLCLAFIAAILLVGLGAQASTHILGGVLTPFSMSARLEDFIRGILDSTGFVYFISMSAFFIFLTQRVIDSKRWR
jgi:ABC-2 type transport system permease protein